MNWIQRRWNNDYYREGPFWMALSIVGVSRSLTYCGKLVMFWKSHVRHCAECRSHR